MQRKCALGAQLDSYDPRTVSWTLLRNDSNCGCGFWDSSRTTLEFPAPNTDELGPVRGIVFAILGDPLLDRPRRHCLGDLLIPIALNSYVVIGAQESRACHLACVPESG